jgi:cysteine protease ATG4
VFVVQLGRNHKPIFTIQDEPPTWPSDTEFMSLESISEPDGMDMDDNDDNDKEEQAQDDRADEPFFDTHDGTVIVDFSRCECQRGALILIRRKI